MGDKGSWRGEEEKEGGKRGSFSASPDEEMGEKEEEKLGDIRERQADV